MDSARGLAALVVLACLLGLPATASADTTSSVDRGGARGTGLTRAERNALDIRSIRASGGPWGVIVHARFKGNVRALGRGGLRRALVAMVLHPRTSDQNAVVLATQGPLRRTDTLRSTRSEEVAVVRDGRQIDFLVFGGGLENVERIEVKAFGRRPGRGARTAAEREFTDAEIQRLLDAAGSDTGSVDAPSTTDPDVCNVLRDEAATAARQEDARGRERSNAANRGDRRAVQDLTRIIDQIKKARRSTRAALGRLRCFSITATAIGYEHFARETRICGRFDYDLPVAELESVTFTLFRRNQAGVFEEVPGALFHQGTDRQTQVFVTFRIDQYGTYKVVLKDRDLEQPVEIEVDVPMPPPQETRDCGG